MRAIEITTPGGPEVLVPTTRPMPEAGRGEVLIKVEAAGINRPDVFQRLGQYAPPPGTTDLPGLEVAGEIVSGDVGNSGFKIGDKVCALVAGGGYAEYCAAPIEQCLPVPKGLSMIEAAGLPETYFTVWSNVFDRGELAAGESLLVHGGASGIGTTAVQLASALGHAVYATVGSDERARAVEALGAAKGINYKTQDFEKMLSGYDLVLNSQDSETLSKSLRVLKPGGKVISISGPPDVEFAKAIRAPWLVQQIMRFLSFRIRKQARQRHVAYAFLFMKANGAQLQKLTQLIESGVIRPVLDKVFPLTATNDALRYVESGRAKGKVVIKVL